MKIIARSLLWSLLRKLLRWAECSSLSCFNQARWDLAKKTVSLTCVVVRIITSISHTILGKNLLSPCHWLALMSTDIATFVLCHRLLM
jgi:hypothetical protein